MRTGGAALIAAMLLVAEPALSARPAAALALEGKLTQGSLVLGMAEPGARARIDGKAVRVGPDGGFLIALGHDAPPEVTLEVDHADGSAEVRALAVERRQWDIQRIEGLPERMVTPKAEDIQRIRDDNRSTASRAPGTTASISRPRSELRSRPPPTASSGWSIPTCSSPASR